MSLNPFSEKLLMAKPLIYMFNRSSNYEMIRTHLPSLFETLVLISYEYEGNLHVEVFQQGKPMEEKVYWQMIYRNVFFPFAVLANSLIQMYCFIRVWRYFKFRRPALIVENWLHGYLAFTLRALHVVNPLIYWVGDWLYLPKQPWFHYANWNSNVQSLLFLLSDFLTCWKADRIWNTTKRIELARQAIPYSRLCRHKEIVLHPLLLHQSSHVYSKNRVFRIVYFGTLTPDRHLPIMLEAIRSLLDAGLHIHFYLIGIAINQYDIIIKKLVSSLHIMDHVTIWGAIDDISKINDLLLECDCGIALAETEKTYHTYYAWTSKIACYLSLGIPVITTRHSSELADLVFYYRSGYCVENTIQSIAQGIYHIYNQLEEDGSKAFTENIGHMMDSISSWRFFLQEIQLAVEK